MRCVFGVEDDELDRQPVARRATPALGVCTTRAFVQRVATREDCVFAPMMTLVGRHVLNCAVAVCAFVPLDEASYQQVADASLAKGSRGYAGVCFRARNSASEYGLSSETCGRLKEGMTPSHCSVETIVLPRMGPPLSECSTRPRGSTLPSEHDWVISAAATSADSRSAMRQPTMRRLHTSMMR